MGRLASHVALTLALSACSDPATSSEPARTASATPTAADHAPTNEHVTNPASPEATSSTDTLPASRRRTIGGYVVDVGRPCDGFPALAVRTPPGLCVGLVATSEDEPIAALRGRFRPRTIAQDPLLDDVLWVTDAGARTSFAGRLLRLRVSARAALEQGPPSTLEATVVVPRLDRPHGTTIGPDGWLYFSDLTRILRIDPRHGEPRSTLEVVLDDLPSELASGERIRFHPLKAFAFAPDCSLYVDMGSATDHCAESLVEPPAPQPPCHDELDHTASIWHFRAQPPTPDGRLRFDSRPEHVAHGLRNSVALAVHGSGTVLQAENGVDFAEADRPHEELNIVLPGRHYGWPYCFDHDRPDPRWARAGFACDPHDNPRYEPPTWLLPPHGAPLDLRFYDAALVRDGQAPSELAHRLLVTLHGFRSEGHRVIAFEVDAHGVPTSEHFDEIIADWTARQTGLEGTPVSTFVARDGSVFVVEDNNGTIVRLARDAFPIGRTVGPESTALIQDEVFATLHRDVLLPRCAHCHEALRGQAPEALAALRAAGWLRTDDEGVPTLWLRTRSEGSDAPRMPLDGTLSAQETRAIRRWLDTLE